MSIAGINKAAEDNANVWNTYHGIGDKPASDVVLAHYCSFLWIFVHSKEINITNLEEEMNEDVAIYCVYQEVDSQEQVYKSHGSPLLYKSPAYERL